MATVLAEERREIARKAREVWSKKKDKTRNQPKPTEPIRPEAMYAIELLPSFFGIGRFTVMNAERDGLALHKFGCRKYVMGSDLIEHIRNPPKSE